MTLNEIVFFIDLTIFLGAWGYIVWSICSDNEDEIAYKKKHQ